MDSTFLIAQRRRRNLSADEVAARLGVHRTSVHRWERRVRLPGPGHIRGLAESLAMDTAQVAAFFDAARSPSPGSPEVVRGQALRWLRTRTGVTVQQLARSAEVRPSTVYNWEAGRAGIPLALLPRLAGPLDLDPEGLAGLLRSGPAQTPPPPAYPLRRLRHRTGLSQAQVATRIGHCRKTLGAWERGATPPLVALRLLARVYGVPVSTVARAAGVTPPPLLDPRSWRPGDLAAALTTLRAWSGLTQGELAVRLGCSTPAVRGWEKARTRPTPRLRRQLERLYGLTEGALLTAYPSAG